MVDEMDLLKDLRHAEPLRPHAYDEARGTLLAAMAEEAAPETKTVPRWRARWGMRRTLGLGAALVAASVAAALVVTSGSTSGGSAVKPVPESANPILINLVAENAPLQPKGPGDATLVIRSKSQTSDKVTDYGVELMTDDQFYYWGVDKAALRRSLNRGDQGDDQYKRNVEVALYAVNGDIGTARARMTVAHLPPGSKIEDELDPRNNQALISKLKAKAKAENKKYVPPKAPTAAKKEGIIDNRLWMNSTAALTAAPGIPKVRAGVLRILASMPRVKVAKTTTAGLPTLTLSGKWSATDADELVIDATTGQPISMAVETSGVPGVTLYYHTTRVKIADVKAGRF